MKLFGQRRVTIGFVVGILFLIFTTFGTVTLATQYQQTVIGLRHYDSLQTTISGMLTDFLNAETGQRGYIITGNSTYLDPYYSALASIGQTNSSLKILSAGDSNLTAGYQELQPLIAEKLAELNETIFLRSTQGFAAAQAAVNTNVGQIYMNQIRTIIGGMSSYVAQQQARETSLASSQEAGRVDSAYFDTVVALAVIGFAIYSVRKNLDNEEKATREAQLLQDILTHDIRNYNQITKLSAELLQGKNLDPESGTIISAILQSVDGSTQLVDRAKRLGKILSEGKVKLYPVDLASVMRSAMELAKSAYNDLGKKVDHQSKFESPNSSPRVLADSLLDDVFVNLYSNSIKYTEGQNVHIESTVTDDEHFWKVSISDAGKGISNERKGSLFSRYMNSSSGSGLGMSIVYALVVQRFKGKIKVRNRVESDYTQGTIVEMWLRKAD